MSSTFALYFMLLAAFVQCALAKDKSDFPLVGLCLGITAAGIIVVLILSLFRPKEQVKRALDGGAEEVQVTNAPTEKVF